MVKVCNFHVQNGNQHENIAGSDYRQETVSTKMGVDEAEGPGLPCIRAV